MKSVIWVSLFIGSTIGSYVPTLWHADLFSIASLVGSTVGGFVGLWIGYRVWKAYLE